MSDEQVKGIPGLPDKWKLIHCTATNPSNPDHPFGKWRDADILNLLREIASMAQALAALEARNRELEAVIYDANATLCECRGANREGCNCDVHAAHRILRAALKGAS